jgi:hypothetical protein
VRSGLQRSRLDHHHARTRHYASIKARTWAADKSLARCSCAWSCCSCCCWSRTVWLLECE